MPSLTRPLPVFIASDGSAARLGCVLAAVALNAGVIAALPGSSPASPVRHALQISLIEAASPLASTTAPGTVRKTGAPLPKAPDSPNRAPAAARESPAPKHKVAVRPLETSPGPKTPETPEPASVPATRFYSFNEVDVPAAPASDWELDAATLDAARTPHIVFDLFVRDDGSVVECTIVEPADMDAAVRTALETRLRTTVLQPAIRTGQRVDSVRRIELFVS